MLRDIYKRGKHRDVILPMAVIRRLDAALEPTKVFKICPNEAFGYWEIVVERPLRISNIEPDKVYKSAEIKKALKAERGTSFDATPVLKKKTRDTIEYKPDPDLRDTEQASLLEEGGIEAFFKREVLPYISDAWIDYSKAQIGYEISFTRHFYKPTTLRSLEEIRADILNVQEESKGLMDEILGIKTWDTIENIIIVVQYG